MITGEKLNLPPIEIDARYEDLFDIPKNQLGEFVVDTANALMAQAREIGFTERRVEGVGMAQNKIEAIEIFEEGRVDLDGHDPEADPVEAMLQSISRVDNVRFIGSEPVSRSRSLVRLSDMRVRDGSIATFEKIISRDEETAKELDPILVPAASTLRLKATERNLVGQYEIDSYNVDLFNLDLKGDLREAQLREGAAAILSHYAHLIDEKTELYGSINVQSAINRSVTE